MNDMRDSLQDSADKWKDKYYGLLDRLDASEKQYQADHALLSKTLVRLAYAVTGFNPTLDPHLLQIRDTLKAGLAGEPLQQALEAFSLALREMEAISNSDAPDDDASAIRTQCLTLLEQTPVPDVFSEPFNALCQQLQSPNADTPLPALLQHAMQLVLAIKDHLALEEHLALEQTLALERLEFVDYFSKLSEQLNELSLKATGMAVTRQQAHKKRNLLDTTISEQITDLQQQTHAASNLEQLKQSLNSQLSKVFENIELSKMQADLERSSMELELQALSSEISSIKQESTTLKSRLEQLKAQPNAALLINETSELPFSQRLTLEISRSKHNGHAITVMAIAIDHYLELFSQNALNKMVDIIEQFLRKNCRQSDFMTRESDDGFVMVLPGTDSNGAKALVAKLQTALDKALLKVSGGQLSISLSFGISQVLLDDPKHQVIDRAKTALTVAQQKGSNQFSIG